MFDLGFQLSIKEPKFAGQTFSSCADDLSYVGELLKAVTALINAAESKKILERKLMFLGKKKSQRRIRGEHAAIQTAALGAARLGLPSPVLLRKVGTRCFEHVNNPDPLGARHALALAALVASVNSEEYGIEMLDKLATNVQVTGCTECKQDPWLTWTKYCWYHVPG